METQGGRHLKDGARCTSQGPIQGKGWWSLAGPVQPRNGVGEEAVRERGAGSHRAYGEET